jgi:hypothetical protein
MDLSEVATPNAPRHPWETARAKVLRTILSNHGIARVESLLDYGCGDAFTGRFLGSALAARRLVGVDTALEADRTDETPFVMLRDRAALASERFELLLLLDVLEHADDDLGLLSELVAEHVARGGRVLITVPAGPRLFGPHDAALGHRRRYRRRSIVEVVEKAGLEVLESGHLFASLYAMRAAERAAELAFPGFAERPRGIGRWRGGARVTRMIETVLVNEARALNWLTRRNAPAVGLSAWVLSQRS